MCISDISRSYTHGESQVYRVGLASKCLHDNSEVIWWSFWGHSVHLQCWATLFGNHEKQETRFVPFIHQKHDAGITKCYWKQVDS